VRFHPRSAWLVVLCCGSLSVAAGAQESAPSSQRGSRFWRATAGVATVNFFTWAYNWYVQRWHWAKVGTVSWGRNLRDGFVWDNDCFLDNQLAHPYHGSLYHSSARASGYGFWGSVPFAAAGSATWELFGENITASLNDLINTTLGGAALGEVTYRLSALLGSKRAAGPNLIGREVGAFALSPLGRAQGLLGSAGKTGSVIQPLDQVTSLAFGRRSDHPFFQLAVRYGSPFDDTAVRPYDAFDFRLQVSPDPGGSVREVAVSGLLARKRLGGSRSDQTVLGLFQHYDYEDLSTFELGGHSLSGAVLYQRRLGERNRIELGAHLEGVLLGAISSDYGFEWRRDYDLGPGAGARLDAAFVHDGREWLRLESRVVWLHSVHGSDGEHVATLLRAAAALPLVGPLGAGGDVALATRHSSYPDFASVDRRVPEMRAYLTWAP
jgi:hypothetical protein